MKEDLLLAIDVGTGSARAALVTEAGKIVAFAAQELDQTVPHFAWSQQSPRTWWKAVASSIRRVIAEIEHGADRIAGIAVCGQMHGTVLVDNAGEPVLEEVPLWNDKRTRELVDRFSQEHDVDALVSMVANPPTVAWPAFKLAWIKQNQPNAYNAARTLLMPKDYINFKLTGEPRTDYCEASCSYMFDIQSRAWSSKILALLGLDPNKLPSVSLASDLLGAVTKEAAQVTGLKAGTPVAVGAGDFPVALVGSGVTRPGMACDITGTSTLTALLAERPTIDPKISNLQCIIGGWAAFTIVDAGGDAVRWARSVFHDQACSYDQMVSMAAAAPPGSEQLLFLPYLNAERLARKSNSRAQLFGLTSRHSAAHLHRAVLEGIAFASRRNMELMKSRGGRFERMIAAAGGAKSRLWLEIKATIYNCPILIPSEPECGVLGCAMLAGCAAGLFSNLEAVVSQQIRYDKEIVPNAAWSERYEKMRSLFDDLYETSERYWDRFES